MLIKQNLKREKKKKREKDKREWRSWGEKRGERKKKMDVDVFYLRGRRRRRREEEEEDQACLLWNEGFYLLRYFTDE
jgi:hypothetical protein